MTDDEAKKLLDAVTENTKLLSKIESDYLKVREILAGLYPRLMALELKVKGIYPNVN